MEIQLLGNVEIHGSPGPIRLERAGEVAVLAVLAFNTGKPVSPAALVDHLWEPPEQTDKSLETVAKYVRTLRAALVRAGGQREWLVYDSRAGTYLLDINPAWVDYHRFTELVAAAHRGRDTSLWEQALALWSGPALGGVTGPWARNRRHVLDTERLAAYDALLADYLAAGRHAEVTRITAMLVDEVTPTDRLLLQGAQALAGAGRHTAIPGWKQHVTARMRQTADATPSAEVLDEIDQITAHPAPWHPHPERGPATAMFSLRSDIATFTGRDEELRTLLDTVLATLSPSDRDDGGSEGEDGGVRAIAIHTVDGMPGVGKTTFTVHAAHRLATRFPDGNLFLDLQGHAPGQHPLSPGAALESLLVANGVDPKLIPTKLEDRARLWRDRLAGQRVLLVLDDAADHDQVRPLLPGTAGNLVLITSRHRLAALDGVTPLTLDILPPDQAITLLLRLSGRHATSDSDEQAGMVRIVASCGYLPLAITLAGAHLRNHPRWSSTYLADLLAVEHERLEHLDVGDRSVRAAFAMSFRDRPAAQQRLFGLLGVHPGPDIDLYATAALTGETLRETRRGVAGLHAVGVATTAVAVGSAVTLGALVALGAVSTQPRVLIPIGGMVVAGAMQSTAMVLRRLREEADVARSVIEARLSLALSAQQAFLPHQRSAIRTALMPAIDSTKVVGLISLPGAMTGLIIAGIDPLTAIRYQIIVMYMMLAATALAALVATRLAERTLFDDAQRLVALTSFQS